MGGEERFNLPVVFGNAEQQGAELASQTLHPQRVRRDDGRIGGQRCGGFDLGKSLVNAVGTAAVVGVVEEVTPLTSIIRATTMVAACTSRARLICRCGVEGLLATCSPQA